jgi:hypothetical protein
METGMTYQDACLRLANHANLAGEQLPADESFAVVLGIASRRHAPPDLRAVLADIIACLEAVNHELNGPVPSESIGGNKERDIAAVAYAVSGIVVYGLQARRRWEREGLFTPQDRDGLLEAVYRIAYAWDQVLAGDIDDILEGVEF